MIKLKGILLVLFLQFTLSSVYAEPLYAEVIESDTAYVTALSGLKLRLTPNTQSEVITVLQFGEQITLVCNTHEEAPTINWTPGEWAEVQYETVTGYVHNGFISRLPVGSPGILSDDFSLCLLLEEYVDEIFTPVEWADTIEFHTGLDRHFHVKYEYELQEGVVYHYHLYWDRERAEVFIPQIRVMDAYYLIRSLLIPYRQGEKILDDIIYIKGNKTEINEIVSRKQPYIKIKEENGGVRIAVQDFVQGC